MDEALEKGLEAERPGDAIFDFGEFFGGEIFPARADGHAVAKAAEKKLDFGEGEAHFPGETDEQDTINSIGRIAALAAETLRRREEARFFVVADSGGIQTGATGKLTNFHGGFLSGPYFRYSVRGVLDQVG